MSTPNLDALLGQIEGFFKAPAPKAVYDPPAGPHDRQFIRTLMFELDLDVLYVTAAHRRFFDAAGLTADVGADVDAVLSRLTKPQAKALAAALKKEVPDVE